MSTTERKTPISRSKTHFSTIIIGGGAAGLACAAHLKNDFLLLEANGSCGAKLTISGGGRCNFTNEVMDESHFTGDASFVKAVLKRFSYDDMMEFVKKLGIAYGVQKNRQLFCKHSAKELLFALMRQIPQKNIKTFTKVEKVEKNEKGFLLLGSFGTLTCDKLIVATGGLSYPQLGISDIGHRIAHHFWHKIVVPSPALVGFSLQPNEAWMKELSGVSVLAELRVGDKSFSDSVLFAHRGVSGPAILNASLYWEKGLITVDFLPEFDMQKAFVKEPNKQISSLLPLPKRMIKVYLEACGLQDKVVSKLSSNEMSALKKLTNYSFAPAGNFGYKKAEITRGGVATDCIDPFTMQSSLVEGLYFVGEVLNVNGELGGYNIHWAFASGVVCAEAINRL